MLQTAASGDQPDHYVDCYCGVDLLRLLGLHHNHLNAVQHVQFVDANDIYDDYVKVLVRRQVLQYIARYGRMGAVGYGQAPMYQILSRVIAVI